MSIEYVNPSGLEHYDEKIKEVIAKKQDQLVGTEGQVVSFDTDGNVIAKDLENHIELTQSEYDALSEEEKNNGDIYFVTDENESDNTIVCRTTVSDIPLTIRTISDTYFKDGEGSYQYYVKNGICTIFLGGQTLDLSNNIVNAMWGKVPKPVCKYNYYTFIPFGSGSEAAIWIDTEGNFRFNCYASTKDNKIGQFTGYFCYPVAETN